MIDGAARGHRINTTSSTMADVVGVHESMPAILWMCYFLNVQGYPLRPPTKVYQDNLSGKQLETDEIAPSSKRTRHTNIGHFSIADVTETPAPHN